MKILLSKQKKNHRKWEILPKMPFFDLWPPYTVQKLFWSSPNGYHLKDHWHSNIIHQFQYIYCFFKVKNSQKMMNFAKNDLIWPLTSVEAPKFLFEFDHSHICCKVWYAEQVALFSGSVAPKLREKNVSNGDEKCPLSPRFDYGNQCMTYKLSC